MTIHSLPLSSIQPSGANPRSAIDPAGIERLAASILADGLLQNLVVSPTKGRKQRFRLISGERRYRALQLLHARGDIPADYAVSVEIRGGLSPEDTLRLATVENVQREHLAPLDEASAFASLLQGGAVLEDISARMGLSVTTIKRRLALASLANDTQAALTSGAITLAQAEALTLGSHKAQRAILEQIAGGYAYDAESIRRILLERKPSVAMARFPLEQYHGTRTADLFGEEHATYFDDVEQFFALQRQAVAALAEQYAATADWVEITEHYQIPRWQYLEAHDLDAAGVLINLSPAGHVDVLEGLARPQLDPETAEETAETPVAPPRARPAYSTPLCRSLAHHKSMAVQHVVLAHPRTAKEVAVLLMLRAADTPSIRLAEHPCLREFAQADAPPASYRDVEQHAMRLAVALHLADSEDEDDACRPGWQLLLHASQDKAALYEAVQALSDADLDALHLLLPILCFGQGDCDRLETGDTLFNRVACDLGVDMRAHWQPDAAFLSRRTREQLVQIAAESGLTSRLGWPSTMKKAELVKALAQHFQRVRELDTLGDADQKARDWLPDAMRFPTLETEADAPADAMAA